MRNKLFLFLLLALSLFGKESTEILFYVQDAGETYALLPVIQRLEEKGADFLLLVAGVAEEVVPQAGIEKKRIRTFQDLGIKERVDRRWMRTQKLSSDQIESLVEQIEAKKVVTGVAFELQGQLLQSYRDRGAATFAYWDNFSSEGENPYFQTAHAVETHAEHLLLPSQYLNDLFADREGKQVVGQPTLQQWEKELATVDVAELRQRLDIEEKEVALFIGSYGPDYEEAFQLFLEGAALTPDVLFLVQPHPKMRGESLSVAPIRVLNGEISTIEAVALADLVICHQSTVAYQALAANKPVLHVIPPSQTFDSLALQKGLAHRVSEAALFPEAIHSAMKREVNGFYELFGIPKNSTECCLHALLEGNTMDFQRIPVRENGLVATLFLPASKTPLPVIITLGGSRGGLREGRAQLLASHGFAALALAYFNEEDLPEVLKEIPLEYFQTAIEWLKTDPRIDAERVGLWGVSRGAELSLLLGTVFPEEIGAITAYVPSSVIYGAITDREAPAWVYQGKPLGPNAPFSEQDYDGEMGKTPEKAIALTPSFLLGMEDKAAFAAAAIPVEKIQCPILLVSGEDDQMWPSTLFSQQIVDRLQMQGALIPCTHLSYPGAGHSIFPTASPTGSLDFHPIAKLWFTFGGNPKDDTFAQKDAAEKTLQFFKTHLLNRNGQ